MAEKNGISVSIQKNLGRFQLNIAFTSHAKRLGILGASGCGKSLTLKSIAGIEEPDSGRICIGGRVLFDSKERLNLRPQKRRVGYLFQNYALFPTMTVAQNIAAGLTGNKAKQQERVAEMIDKFQLRGLEKHFPGQLSGGQQQRVALARIMAYEPEMILLDEPFSALDVHLRDKMQRELMEMLKGYPGTVILVSHSRDEIYRMSDEVLILEAGRLVGQGPTKEVFLNPGNVETARLTGCKNIAAVQVIGGGMVQVENWGMTLPVKNTLKGEIRAVGIRAHEFEIVKTQENEELVFQVIDPVITEDMFEYNISFWPSQEAKERIDWKISKKEWGAQGNKLPDKIYLKNVDLLLLG
ncbi:sulfate/molybdate ABC transporter ATP-binding protein [Roseburia hominis]